MCCSPETNSCISGRNFVKDKSDILSPCSAAAAKMSFARVDSMADCILSCWFSKVIQQIYLVLITYYHWILIQHGSIVI
jgi:hypothetical protein